jgi:hypothetical protein
MTPPPCMACGDPVRVVDGKRGGYSLSCPSCGFQGFLKTPKAAAAFGARLLPTATPATPETPARTPAPAAKKPVIKAVPDSELFGL